MEVINTSNFGVDRKTNIKMATKNQNSNLPAICHCEIDNRDIGVLNLNTLEVPTCEKGIFPFSTTVLI